MTALGDFRDNEEDITGGTAEQEQRHARIAKLNSGLQLPRGTKTGSSSVAASAALQQTIIGKHATCRVVEAQLVDEQPQPATDQKYFVSYDQIRRATEIAGNDLGRVSDVVQSLTVSFSKNPESGVNK